MNPRNLLLSGALLFLLSACPTPSSPESVIYLSQLTGPSVSLVAEVNHPFEAPPTIRLSKSSVMGVSCTEGCFDDDDNRSACQGVVIRVSPPELASVLPAHRPGVLEPHVLIGNQVGSGTVEISTACATNTYQITIEP